MSTKEENERIDFLVRQSQKGTTEAFSELYDLFFQKIHKYVFYKVNKEDVDDVVASIFIKAWTKIKSYKKTRHTFNSWIFRIAHNTVIDHYRTHKAVYNLDESLGVVDESADPTRMAEKSLNSKRVHRALQKLGDKYQEVVLYKFIHDMPNSEIAQIMNTKETTVRSLQHRALKQLKSVLEEEEAKTRKRLMEAEERPVVQKGGFFSKIFAKN
jgi:RNA polymerase sigma factor (sigma-70 family)